MPRYAVIDRFDNWKEVLPNGKEEAVHGQIFIALDSMRITKEEIDFLKRKRSVYCPFCEEKVHYRSGHTRNGEYINPHWYHRDGKERCRAEGVAHAITKRFIFGKLKDRGYTVKEERRHKIGDKFVRADVAVLENQANGEVLKLVVEVQASNTTVAEVKKRMAAYYQEKAPVAWVLLLDSFFPYGYTIDSGKEYDKDSGMIVDKPIISDQEYPFALTGSNNLVFNFLMDTYFYTIGIRNDGKVFLIRRSPDAARKRELHGEKWTYQDDFYLASLIRDDKIADVLLQTPIIPMEYVPAEKKKTTAENEITEHDFKGYDCLNVFRLENDGKNAFIDFEGGRTTENTLDTLKLIRETQEAARRARLEAEERKRQERLEAEKKREEERKRQAFLEEKRRQAAEQARRRLEEQKRQELEAEIRHIEEQERIARFEEERRRIEEELRKEHIKQMSLSDEERERFVEQRLLEDDRRGFARLHYLQRQAHQKEEEEKRKEQAKKYYVEPFNATDEQKAEMRTKLWQEYLQVPKEERAQWEKERFIYGQCPWWFTTRKIQLLKKENEERKTQERQERQLHKQLSEREEAERNETYEQLKLFDFY